MANGDETTQYDLRDEKRKKKGVVKLNPQTMQTAMELTGMGPELMDKALKQAGQVYDTSFEYEEFTDEDQAELNQLKNVVSQNQPVDVPAPIQSLLPGNPYATNFEGLSSGVQNLVGSLVNEERMNKLYGDPEKVDTMTKRAQEKMKKAKRLRQTADEMEQAGRGTPADNFTPISELRADAEALEQKAQQDLQAAEQAKGAVTEAQELKEQKQQKEDRQEFVQDTAQTTYEQALEGEREARKQESITERERIRQKHLTQRNIQDLKSSERTAKIKANAEVEKEGADDPKWPTPANPKFVQKYIGEFKGTVEDQIEEMEDQLFMEETGEMKNTMRDTEQAANYERLLQTNQILEEVNRDAIYYEQLKEDGMTADELNRQLPRRAPTPQEREVLLRMRNELGMPMELIEAFKFYNRISLNKAPQGPDQTEQQQQQQNPANMGGAFQDNPPGTGVLQNEYLDGQSDNENE